MQDFKNLERLQMPREVLPLLSPQQGGLYSRNPSNMCWSLSSMALSRQVDNKNRKVLTKSLSLTILSVTILTGGGGGGVVYFDSCAR